MDRPDDPGPGDFDPNSIGLTFDADAADAAVDRGEQQLQVPHHRPHVEG